MELNKRVYINLTDVEGVDAKLMEFIKEFFQPVQEVGDPVSILELFHNLLSVIEEYLKNITPDVNKTMPIDEILALMPEITPLVFESIVGQKALSILIHRELKEFMERILRDLEEIAANDPCVRMDVQYNTKKIGFTVIVSKLVK